MEVEIQKMIGQPYK